MSRALLLVLIALCLSCAQADRNSVAVAKYFDINGLIDHQARLLDTIDPSFYKEAIINGTIEKNTFTNMDQEAWKRELAIFRTADINQPRLVDSYTTTELESSDTKKVIYMSRFPNNTLVDSLTINFDRTGEHLSSFHVKISNRNPLFESTKHIDLRFAKIQDQDLLSSYVIEGWQKMIAQDSSKYKITGSFSY